MVQKKVNLISGAGNNIDNAVRYASLFVNRRQLKSRPRRQGSRLKKSMMDASRGYDTVKYREPLGVFAGIAPVNFPAMIPFGWMAPTCIATGNTMVLKAASLTPRTALKLAARPS